MTISADTKIAAVLKEKPDALEAIIQLSTKFVKLRNPVLRKLMAGRTSILQASKIGGCTIEDFFTQLEPLGFKADRNKTANDSAATAELPEFIKALPHEKIAELDVRPIISAGKDPLKVIVEKLKTVGAGTTLKLINSFVPTPLIGLLEKQGYQSAVEFAGEDTVVTYFFRDKEMPVTSEQQVNTDGWDDVLSQFAGKMASVDVRELEMPQPMLTILDALDKLPAGEALHVSHKRIPVFLLPELAGRKFDYRIKEISESEVHLLIFRP